MSRMPQERLDRARQQLEEISEADHAKVKGLAEIVKPLRSFIHKTPDDHGMTDWSNIYFQSDDGVSLEGWYIPAKGGESNKLIIFNHALPMCRSGFPGHFGPPWSGFDAVEIDFVIQMKLQRPRLRHPQSRQQRCRERRTQRHRALGVA